MRFSEDTAGIVCKAEEYEEIDVPFENDEAVIGRWEMLDHLPCKEMFFPGGQLRNGFLNSKDGSVTIDKDEIWRWVNGYVICNPKVTASKYVIEQHEGTEYLFVLWKSGDYSYGGEQPFWYVFQR